MSATQYAETAALLAIMEGDHAEARRILLDFHPRELADLRGQAQELIDLIGEVAS